VGDFPRESRSRVAQILLLAVSSVLDLAEAEDDVSVICSAEKEQTIGQYLYP
jgi:hypothetical protein